MGAVRPKANANSGRKGNDGFRAMKWHLEGCSSLARGVHHLGDNGRLLCEGQSANARRHKALAFLAKWAAKTVV